MKPAPKKLARKQKAATSKAQHPKKPTKAPKSREVAPQKADAKQAERAAIARDADADRNLPPAELAIIDQAIQRNRARPTRLGSKLSSTDGGMTLSPDFGSKTSYSFRQLDAFGTTSYAFAGHSIGWLAAIARKKGESLPDQQEMNAALAVVSGFQPENELEAMLLMQMYAAHGASAEMMVRMRQASTVEETQNYGAMGTKMMRTFIAQVEALNKIRKGGEQTVRVEHVHVYPRGQAIVGAVTQHSQGGGGTQENLGQPHGPIDPKALAFAPGAPVWREEPGREALPVTSDEGEDTVPVPRRSQGKRRSKGRR